MSALLDPKNDYVFKRLLADEPYLLMALINAVRWDAAPVETLEVRNPAVDAAELRGKYIVLDIVARDATGTHYNVEMQVRRLCAWSARSTCSSTGRRRNACPRSTRSPSAGPTRSSRR